MYRPAIYLKYNQNNEIAVEQCTIGQGTNEVRLSFNPDDERFYVEVHSKAYPDEWRTRGVQKLWRNATARARMYTEQADPRVDI
ncbi:MAG: hypothetical protein ACREBW_01990 [Candidatus Micrarchaeaceae archaeon]